MDGLMDGWYISLHCSTANVRDTLLTQISFSVPSELSFLPSLFETNPKAVGM